MRLPNSQLAKLLRCSSSALQTSTSEASAEVIRGCISGHATIVENRFLPSPSSSSFKTASRRSISTTAFSLYAANDNKNVPDSDEAFQELAEAFSGLITTAYDLMAKGRPAEAEMLLKGGAEQAEEALGAGSVQVAPLWDQLALFQFMHDRCQEAVVPCLKALEAVRNFASQEGSPQAQGAAATAAVRYATCLVGCGNVQEAAPLLGEAIAALDTSIAALLLEQQHSTESGGGGGGSGGVQEAVDDDEEMQQYLEKFNTAKGEAIFYSSLCALASQSEPTPELVDSLSGGMEEGLRGMTKYLGPRHPLTACALREHNRLTEGAVDSERGPLAESLYFQEIRLHQAFDPDGEQTAALYYQLGTLQYCCSRHEAAIRSLERAVRLLETQFEGADEHLMTVRHRLGMALGASGKHAHARDVLNSVAALLTEKLGDGNPITHELEFMLALMKLNELKDNASEYSAVLGEMETALNGLKPFGEEHMLVKFAEKLFEEAAAAVEVQQKKKSDV